MSIPEFREVCANVFEVIEENGKRRTRGFPEGCDNCPSEIEWDCYHKNDDGSIFLCQWRENYWKYDEIRKYMVLANAQDGGLDLNRVKSLDYVDFVKLHELKKCRG
jgi:hypothetical protein